METSGKRLAARVLPVSPEGRVLQETAEVSFDHLVEEETGNVFGAEWWTPEALEIDGTAASAELPRAMRLAIDAMGEQP